MWEQLKLKIKKVKQ